MDQPTGAKAWATLAFLQRKLCWDVLARNTAVSCAFVRVCVCVCEERAWQNANCGNILSISRHLFPPYGTAQHSADCSNCIIQESTPTIFGSARWGETTPQWQYLAAFHWKKNNNIKLFPLHSTSPHVFTPPQDTMCLEVFHMQRKVGANVQWGIVASVLAKFGDRSFVMVWCNVVGIGCAMGKAQTV